MSITNAQKKANAKYKEKAIKRVPLDMQIKDYALLKAHAEARGESINGFIKRAIAETIERDNT